jgi:tol-pal system protein YbgF
MKTRSVPRLAKVTVFAVLAMSTSGCLASVAQLDEVREDVSSTRAETVAADSVRAMQIVQILNSLRDLSDSVASLNQRLARLRAETQADVREVRLQVSQMQEATTQSETRFNELRSQINARTGQSTPATVAPPTPRKDTVASAPPAAPVEEMPGEEELYRIGRDQLARGGNSAGRAALTDLLTRFPESELAADAQFLIAESHSAEGKTAAADSAYARVVSRFGDSPRAPTALYKRGVMAQTARRTTTAKRFYNELIQKYPLSDEAELARERLRVMN